MIWTVPEIKKLYHQLCLDGTRPTLYVMGKYGVPKSQCNRRLIGELDEELKAIEPSEKPATPTAERRASRYRVPDVKYGRNEVREVTIWPSEPFRLGGRI